MGSATNSKLICFWFSFRIWTLDFERDLQSSAFYPCSNSFRLAIPSQLEHGGLQFLGPTILQYRTAAAAAAEFGEFFYGEKRTMGSTPVPSVFMDRSYFRAFHRFCSSFITEWESDWRLHEYVPPVLAVLHVYAVCTVHARVIERCSPKQSADRFVIHQA